MGSAFTGDGGREVSKTLVKHHETDSAAHVWIIVRRYRRLSCICAGIGYDASMTNQHTYSVPFSSEQLRSDYHEGGMSQTEIAIKYGVSQKVVWKAMMRFGIKARIAVKRNQKGELNDSWKGSAAGYAAFHKRMESLKGRPKKCERCGTDDETRTYDWANLTGQYDDPNDYQRMCRSCHWKCDQKILNIKRMRRTPREES